MLGIERDAVKWEAYAGAHHIQERQIVVIAHYLENLGTQSMLICGFAFGSLFGGMMELPEDADEEWSEAWFMITVCICAGLMFFVIVASTLVASLGPQMALRGEDAASMRIALEYMKSYRKYIVRSFAGGCASFFIVVLQIGWQKARRHAFGLLGLRLAGGDTWVLSTRLTSSRAPSASDPAPAAARAP